MKKRSGLSYIFSFLTITFITTSIIYQYYPILFNKKTNINNKRESSPYEFLEMRDKPSESDKILRTLMNKQRRKSRIENKIKRLKKKKEEKKFKSDEDSDKILEELDNKLSKLEESINKTNKRTNNLYPKVIKVSFTKENTL